MSRNGCSLKSRNLRMSEKSAQREVIVAGGGTAGLRAALEAAAGGARVYLVEKSAFLGGNLLQSDRVVPGDLPAICLSSELINRVLNNPNIEVYTNSTLGRVSARDGRNRGVQLR